MFLSSRVRLTTLPLSVSRLSVECRIHNISQLYKPQRPITGIALFFYFYNIFNYVLNHYIIKRCQQFVL
jgi:hypothetical protein